MVEHFTREILTGVWKQLLATKCLQAIVLTVFLLNGSHSGVAQQFLQNGPVDENIPDHCRIVFLVRSGAVQALKISCCIMMTGRIAFAGKIDNLSFFI